MKFSKIVSVGDSYAWGDELLAPGQTDASSLQNQQYRQNHCYTALVAQYYQVPYETHAFPGGSCISTRSIYSWWFNQESNPRSTLVLAQLSGPWRTSQFDSRRVPDQLDYPWNRFIHSAWHRHYAEHDKLANDYFVLESALTDCSDWHDMIQLETYLFFHGQSKFVSNLVQFNSQRWCSQHACSPDTLLWQGRSIEEILHSKDYFAKGGHPNEYGHKRLAELLIIEIDRVILQE